MVNQFLFQKPFNKKLFIVKVMKKFFKAIKRNLKVSAELGIMNCTGSIPLWATRC